VPYIELFGDSSHRDPEVYEEILAGHPHRIIAGFIHEVNATVSPDRVEGLHLHESYAEVAAILFGLGAITRGEALEVMHAAKDEACRAPRLRSRTSSTLTSPETLRVCSRAVALTATVHHVEIALSDVDRGVYEALDLRVAQHPSETLRFMVTRTLAYALSYEDGIAFSKGGLSQTDEPPVVVRDPTGVLLAWIDVGVPSAQRLHKASKAARRVAVFTAELAQLRREAESKKIHEAETIEVWPLDGALLDAIAQRLDRNTKLELTRSDGQLYVGIKGATLEAPLTRASLLSP
jgi:uncharacterized protein YaeQ